MSASKALSNQQVDRRIGLTERLAQRLPDARDPARCEHSLRNLLRQRIYGLALGYEDLNDHHGLRQDIAMQTAVERLTSIFHLRTLPEEEARDRLELLQGFVLADQSSAAAPGKPTERQRQLSAASLRPGP